MAAGSEVGRTEFGIYANRKPFDQAMNSLQSQADSIGKSIAKKLTAGLSVAGLTKFAKDCLYAGSKLNAMRSMASAAFPSMTKEVQAFANNAAGSFGLSEKMALQYSATLGSMARGMGFTEKQAMQMSTAIAALSGDVASYYSMSQDEAFGKLQAIFTGETESLKSLGVIMTQSALDQYAMANGFGRTTSAMTEQEKVVLRYQFVMSQLNLAQGDFMRTQSAWGNQVKILRMRFAELQAQLGQGLINILKPAIRALNFFMGKLIQVASVFNAFIARITGATKKKGGVKSFASSLYDIGKASKGVGGNLGNISGGTGKVAKGAKKASKAVKALQRELMGFDKMNKLAKKDSSSAGGGAGGGGGVGGAGGLGDIGGYEGDIDGLNDSLFKFDELSKKITGSKIWKALGQVVQAVIRLVKAIGKALAPVGKWIWEHLVKPFGKLMGMAIVGVLEGIAGAFNIVALFVEKHPRLAVMILAVATALFAFKKLGGVMGILLGVNKGMMKLVKAFSFFTKGNVIILALTAIALAIGYIYQNWDKIKKTKFGKALIKVGNALKTVGKLIWKSIVTRFKLMVGTVKLAWAVLKKVGSFFKGAFKKAIEVVSKPLTALKDAWAGIKSKTVELKGKIAEGLENLGEGISDKTAEITLGLKDDFSSAWDKVKGTWEGVKNKTAELWSSLKDTFSNAWDKVKGAWEGVKNKTAELLTSLKDTFSGAWNNIKGVWNSVTGKTAELWASLKDTFSSAWATVKSAWDSAKKALTDKTATLKAQLENAFSSGLSAFKSAWDGAKDKITGKTAEIKAQLSDKFSSGLSAFKAKWNDAKEKIKGKTAELKAKLTTTGFKAYNAIAKKWNKYAAGKSLFGKVLPKMPVIKGLAQGGWVNKNSPQLAVVGDNRHEGEIVAPESKLEAMARQIANDVNSNSSNAQVVSLLSQLLVAVQNQNTSVYLDGKEIARNTVKNINQQTRTTGVSPLLV